MTPTITHISQYNNFNHFNVTHYPQSAKAATTSTRTMGTNGFFPVEDALLHQQQQQQQHKTISAHSPANAQRVSLSDRCDVSEEQDGDHTNKPMDSVQKKRSARKLKIIRNDYDSPSSISPLPNVARTASSTSPPHRPRHRQSSDPNIRALSKSPSLPPLREQNPTRSKSRDRGQSMIMRERVNPRKKRRSKLKVIRDQRKGSDPNGLKERKLVRNRVGAKSTGGRSEEDKQSEQALSALSAVSGWSSSNYYGQYGALLMSKMSRKCHLRFFVEMNGIWTYAVCFESNLCGLELCPIDEHEAKGAVVVKCHSTFSQQMVVEGSLLIGMGNEIVLQMDHSRILKRIRNSPRPLTLTFYHSSKQRDVDRKREQNEQYLCLWLASDFPIAFVSTLHS